jgi:hypothetical protein
MKAKRQVEAIELMIASNSVSMTHAEALLKATPPDQRTDSIAPTNPKAPTVEQIAKLEKEMNQVQTQYQDAEKHYGSDLLNLMVAKGFITKLLANESVKHFIDCNDREILAHFELVINTVSMEEAVQQQQDEAVLNDEG